MGNDDRTGARTFHRPLRRRALLAALGVTAVAPILAACGGSQAPAAAPAPTQGLIAPQTINTASTASAPATPSSAAATGEPRGQVIEAWHTTIAPAWFDPQEALPFITPYNFLYAMHDAVAKHLPGQTFAPSLAESYDIAPDFRSATFRLRPGLTFHDGSPVTPEDVKFTFEQYRGANARILHDKTAAVEAPDARTVRFRFREPFLDFQVLYCSPASGAAWVVPKAYYQHVGPNGFKQHPIGAGPFKFVRQQAGTQLELEAFPGYWRKTPRVKSLIIKAVPEDATRVAMMQAREADIMMLVAGPLLDTVKRDPQLRLAPMKAAPWWLWMMAFDRPDTPLKDVRVRHAISLAINRQAINEAETGGYSLLEGNWIPENWPGAISRPTPEENLGKAKQLMAEAGVPNGFEISQLTPSPPYYSRGERIVSQLREIGIRTKVNVLERGVYQESLKPGPKQLKGLIFGGSDAPGDAAARIREFAMCGGGSSVVCAPEVDSRMKQYEASTDPAERQRLLEEVQNFLLDNYMMVPVFRQAFINAIGPRIANPLNEVFGAIPQYAYAGPFEDISVKDR